MKRLRWLVAGLFIGLLFAGGGVAVAASGGAFDNSIQDAATAQQNRITGRLIKAQPAPNIRYSVERQNLIKRYTTYADPNKISYIALTTVNGSVIYTGVVKGKVSAVSSQLTPADRIQCAEGDSDQPSCATIQVPEPDGTWSTNGAGVFWFDSKGIYHEWNGTYLVADQPFTLTAPPLLTINAEVAR